MNMIAIFWNDIYIYYHSIFITIAILTTILVASAFCKFKCRGSISMLQNVALLAIPLGVVCSRLVYCLSNYNDCKTLDDWIHLTDGGYSLYGAMFGVILAVLVVHIFDKRNSVGLCFDCIGIAAALAVCIGRMASYFSMDNVGIVMNDSVFCFFPFSVYNPLTSEWCFATFIFEAIVEFIMFFCLWALLADNYSTVKKNNSHKGDIGLLFLMMHGALQSLADSMHNKALRFPFNSFVRVQQIIAVSTLVIVFVIFLVRLIKRSGKLMKLHFGYFIGFAAMVGIAAYMEFNRISDTNYWFNHGVMLVALTGCAVICVAVYRKSVQIDTVQIDTVKS